MAVVVAVVMAVVVAVLVKAASKIMERKSRYNDGRNSQLRGSNIGHLEGLGENPDRSQGPSMIMSSMIVFHLLRFNFVHLLQPETASAAQHVIDLHKLVVILRGVVR